MNADNDLLLDNPVWNALISGNDYLSNGNDLVKYFSKEVSPFIGLRQNNEENFGILHQLISFDHKFAVISPNKLALPASWNLLHSVDVFQMVHQKIMGMDPDHKMIAPLRERDVPAMRSLIRLTNPGPFEQGTIRFGHYEGIFSGTKLIAMAGQRLHPFQYAEVSAVCTHPDYAGRGLARKLISSQIQRITAAGDIPFLHVKADNKGAIALYERLGFIVRKKINVFIIEKC